MINTKNNKRGTIKSLSKSKLLPNSDYKKGNYSGNTSFKPGDQREESPRRARLAQRGGVYSQSLSL